VSRISATLAVIFATVVPLAAQPTSPIADPLLKDARIALRMDSGRILIVGGELQSRPGASTIVNDDLRKFPLAKDRALFESVNVQGTENLLRIYAETSKKETTQKVLRATVATIQEL